MDYSNPPTRWYAGIGSRNVPDHVAAQMMRVATRLQSLGFGLRSGAAAGSDSAFEAGVSDPLAKQIYLPWKEFNGHPSSLYQVNHQAMKIAKRFHPRFDFLGQPARKLMARNSFQILGPHLNDPVSFVVCWTPDGCEHADDRTQATGGTGQALSLASAYGVPIFNLMHPSALKRLGTLMRRQGWSPSEEGQYDEESAPAPRKAQAS